MTSYVSAQRRRLVEMRSSGLCEYGLLRERDTYLGCQVDHIISEKHGGATSSENLALACTFCNRAKGSNVGSILADSETFVRLFNPRTDNWSDHVGIKGDAIEGTSSIGEATCRVVDFNIAERRIERDFFATCRTLALVGSDFSHDENYLILVAK